MATLTGTTIKDTYKSLIKVNDNEELAATLQELTDGLGNGSGISINTSGDLKASGILEFGSLKDTGEDITIVKFVDQADGIGSNNNDTTIPTSAAVKDYVDTNVTAQDLDFTGNTGTGAVDLDSQTLNLIGANGVVTTASGQTITIDTSSLDTRLTTAEADIDTNTANIATEISDRTSADSTLQSNIDAEAATRLANDNTLQGNIDTEASTRSSADTTLQANIDTNTANISSNDTDIAGLDTRLTTAEGNITSNDTDIATNASNISTNTSNISTNTSNIATNVTDIATNATNISSNDTDITALQNDKYDKTGGTISGSVTISDDLTVNGTTTTVNTETLSVEDPLIEMANQNAANSVDTGFYAKYSLDSGVTTKYAGLFKDASDSDTFKLFKGLEDEPTTTINTGGTGYALADLDVAGLSASSGTISGDLIVDTNTLYVDSSNNRVGIGTVQPNSDLEISSTVPTIRFTDVSTGDPYHTISGTGNGDVTISVDAGNSGALNSNFIVEVDGTQRFNIAHDGDIAFNTDDLFIDGVNNRVGIGTDSPSFKLDVLGNSKIQYQSGATNNNAPASLILSNTTTGAHAAGVGSSLQFEFNNTSGGFAGAKISSEANADANGSDLVFYPRYYGYSEAMRIDSSGNVLINNTNTALYSATTGSGYLLEDGVMTIARETTADTQPLLVLNDTGVDGKVISFRRDGAEKISFSTISNGLAINTGATERLRIDSSGNVGIGVVPKSSISTVWQHIQFGGTGSIIARHSDTSLDSMFSNNFYVDGSNVDKRIATGEVANLFLDNDEFIFRNAASGAADSTISFTERMRIKSGGDISFRDTSNNEAFYWDASAARLSIGAGSSPSSPLEVLRNTAGWATYIKNSSASSPSGLLLSAGDSGSNFAMYVRNAAETSDLFSIKGNGNVGIGTSNPQTRLTLRELIVSSGGDKDFMQLTYQGSWGSNAYGLAGINFTDNANASNTVGRIGVTYTGSLGAFQVKDLFNSSGYGGSGTVLHVQGDGKVGIGTTSPQRTLDVNGEIQNTGIFRRAGVVLFKADGTSMKIGSSNASGGDITFHTTANLTSADERMRITSGGRVNIGDGYPNGGVSFIPESNNRRTFFASSSTTGGTTLVAFTNPNGVVGTINTSGSTTSYNTSSDYRLKENVVPITGALDRVDALKPSRFNFIADADKTVDGFLAHEVADVVPEAISGEKDAVDEEGNAIYQGIDQSKLVPLLVGAIQELKAEIETLKSQIQ